MSTYACNDFLKQLEAWMDGERSSVAQAHLRDCAHCRGLVEDIGAIRQTAGAWAAEESDPPARVWVSLRAQLAQEGLIRGEEPRQAKAPRGWLAAIFAGVPRPALAGAYLLALIAVSVAFTGRSAKRAQRKPLDQRDSEFHRPAERPAPNRAEFRLRHGRIQSRGDRFPARQSRHR